MKRVRKGTIPYFSPAMIGHDEYIPLAFKTREHARRALRVIQPVIDDAERFGEWWRPAIHKDARICDGRTIHAPWIFRVPTQRRRDVAKLLEKNGFRYTAAPRRFL